VNDTLLLSALCPGAMLFGFISCLVVVRLLGAKWPWEKLPPSRLSRLSNLQSYERERIAAEDAPEITQQEIFLNHAILVHTSYNAPGIVNLHFVKEREQ